MIFVTLARKLRISGPVKSGTKITKKVMESFLHFFFILSTPSEALKSQEYHEGYS